MSETVIADLIESMKNHALQPLKTSFLRYYSVYDQQIWQGGHLLWGAPTHEIILHLTIIFSKYIEMILLL